MILTTYEPWATPYSLKHNLDYLRSIVAGDSDSIANSFTPAVDITEKDDAYVLFVDLPGVDPNEITVAVEGGALTISGERIRNKSKKTQGYKSTERFFGRFSRTFNLPETADPDRIDATGENGVLKVTIAKAVKAEPRVIKVNR